MAGRIITINEGGRIDFVETTANASGGNQYKASILLQGNLTADRTLVIADSDGVLQGLLPGTGWAVSKGGTGLTSLANNVMVAGAGTDTVKLIAAPTTANQVLLYDTTDSTIKWSVLDLSGVEVTTARNLSITDPGVYASKLGSELRFRNILGGSGITVTQNPSDLTIGINQSSIAINMSQVSGNLAFSRVTGTVPVNQGGTGATTLVNGGLLMGQGTGAVTNVSLPSIAGQRLVWDGTSYTWATMKDSIPGFIDLPTPQTYNLELSFPYNCTIDKFLIKTGSGTADYQFLVNSVVITSGTSTTTLTNTTLTGKSITAGQTVQIALSNLASVTNVTFSAQVTRS